MQGRRETRWVSAIVNGVTYHELDHVIRAFSGEEYHSESLADLRAMNQGQAPEYILCHLLDMRGEYNVLLKLGRELNVLYEMKGGKYHKQWIQESGILNLSREELRDLAGKIYDEVRAVSRS